MHSFLKGVAFIEARLVERFTVADVAAAAGYSVFHYCRLFGMLPRSEICRFGDGVCAQAAVDPICAIGAAERLTGGDTVRLIELALDSGFDSQAAFTRAFKRQFGLSPGAVRKDRISWLPRRRLPIDPETLTILPEHFTMEPTFVERSDIKVVGLAQPFKVKEGVDGPSVWRRFRPLIEQIPHRVGSHTFGLGEVVDKAAGHHVYAPAVEVSDLGDPAALETLGLFGKELKGGTFAVFTHKLTSPDIGRQMRDAYHYIYGTWVERSHTELRAWYDFEYYDERFDNETLLGEVDIWVPVA